MPLFANGIARCITHGTEIPENFCSIGNTESVRLAHAVTGMTRTGLHRLPLPKRKRPGNDIVSAAGSGGSFPVTVPGRFQPRRPSLQGVSSYFSPSSTVRYVLQHFNATVCPCQAPSSIQAGTNPRILEQVLLTFLSPSESTRYESEKDSQGKESTEDRFLAPGRTAHGLAEVGK